MKSIQNKTLVFSDSTNAELDTSASDCILVLATNYILNME